MAKDQKFTNISNEQKQMFYEVLVGPQTVNFMIYEEAKASNDKKTMEDTRKNGLDLYKTIIGTDYPVQ